MLKVPVQAYARGICLHEGFRKLTYDPPGLTLYQCGRCGVVFTQDDLEHLWDDRGEWEQL